MEHPKSSQVYAVAKVFYDAIKKYPSAMLDMDETRVLTPNHTCGTIHCHGGWYAVMKCNLNTVRLDFMEGVERMANDLGFEDGIYLKDWAEKNPQIWGNEMGGNIFSWEGAFTSISRPNGALSIKDIADHWSEVAARIELLENNKEL